MESAASITAKLFNLLFDIESIDRQIIQLQMKKEELQQRQRALRAQIQACEAEQDLNNWKIAQNMTVNLLRSEVGPDNFE